MSFIAGYLLGLGSGGTDKEIKPITITENGKYSASGSVGGYNPIDVNVPDRYDEGYQDGYSKGHDDGYSEGYADGESAVKAKIQSKTITENGVYYAADDGLDGFDPVNVQVSSSGGYKIPSSMSADEFIKFVGGDACVTDTTTGVSIMYEYPYGNMTKLLYVWDGSTRMNLFNVPEGAAIDVFTINPTTGYVYAKVGSSLYGNTIPMLIGYGDPTHENIATNS